uniref:Uncharacterized protein n=1 Tax=Romanomermis culicivorax TaxID=13658 RepID=A0A915IR44_ROMCU
MFLLQLHIDPKDYRSFVPRDHLAGSRRGPSADQSGARHCEFFVYGFIFTPIVESLFGIRIPFSKAAADVSPYGGRPCPDDADSTPVARFDVRSTPEAKRRRIGRTNIRLLGRWTGRDLYRGFLSNAKGIGCASTVDRRPWWTRVRCNRYWTGHRISHSRME